MAIRKTVIKRYESQAWVDNYPVTAWAYIENIPSTFPPSAHTHNYAGSSSAGGDANNAVKLNGQAASYYLDYNNFTHTPTIPTKTSQLTNDSGYLTVSTLTGDVVIDALGYTPGTSNFTGYTSSNKLSASYISGLATIATSGSYNDLSNKPTIPTKASWNYDDRYVRYDVNNQGLNATQKANARTNIGAGTSNFSGSYNDLTNKPTIPTKTSQLTNDSGYLTSSTLTGDVVIDALGYTPGTYSKPSGGIPANDLAQTYYLASNPNGYTSNIGTVTTVKLGSTSYSPTSGVISLPAYPTTLPASDVYSWAKAATKPSYTPSEVGAIPIYRYGTQSATTKIKININSTDYWMLCFTVTLYQGYRATKIMISGYNYGYSNQYWCQPEAIILGDSDGTETITVYFGYDSARNLWVGFDGGDYTGVSINDITNGYAQLDHFDELFTISNVSSLSTIQTTITAGSKANYSNNSGKLNNQEASYYLNYNNLSNKPTIPTKVSQLTNDSGYITGITSSMITTALGYTPYNSSNPNGYTSNTGTVTSVAVKMNGTVKGTITASGTIDLGTVITSHQDISGKADKASVTAGWYRRVYVNAQGIVTEGDQGDTDTNTWRKVQLNGVDKLGNATNTNPLNIKNGSGISITESSGAFTFALNLTGDLVTDALGYTPYNSSNPNGYTSNIGTVTTVKLGSTSYSPSSGVISLPAYPTTLPASDVYSWAKAANKPSYNAGEVYAVKYNQQSSGIGSNSTFANAKAWVTSTNLPNGNALVYNTAGTEYSLLFSFKNALSYGTILRWGYNDKYIYIARNSNNVWQSNDWEKISAGYADNAGQLNGQSASYYLNYNNLSNKPTIYTDCVRYVSQSLTDAQKTQARTNIGAGTSNFTGYTSSNQLSGLYVEYNGDDLYTVIDDLYGLVSAKYSKPSGGIPASDLAQSYYLASNPNGYTTNKGTVTSVSVKINGTVKGTVTTSGTIDLGTIGGGGVEVGFVGYLYFNDDRNTPVWFEISAAGYGLSEGLYIVAPEDSYPGFNTNNARYWQGTVSRLSATEGSFKLWKTQGNSCGYVQFTYSSQTSVTITASDCAADYGKFIIYKVMNVDEP